MFSKGSLATHVQKLLLFVLFAALYSCGSEQVTNKEVTEVNAESRNSDGGSMEASVEQPSAWKQPFSPKTCGGKSYEWIPPQKMGKLVSWEKAPAYSMSKENLAALLGATQYKSLLTVKYGVNIYTFRYETQMQGKKVEATGIMAVPRLPAEEIRKQPYIMWLHGTTGYSDACAPSRNQDGPAAVALLSSQGYITVAPDYLGMNGNGATSTVLHPYAIAEATALPSWDAMRAAEQVLQKLPEKAVPTRRVIPWGPSQGGHAALSAILYGPYYAPEFTITAGVVLVPPVNLIEQAVRSLESSNASAYLFAMIASSYSRYYGIPDQLSQVLTNRSPNFFATELPKQMKEKCSVVPKDFKDFKITDLFTDGFIKSLQGDDSWKGFERWRCFFAENSPLQTSVKPIEFPPIFYMVSEKDALVNTASQRKSFAELCAAGHRMEYLECKGASHIDGGFWSLPEQLAWVAQRVAGKPMQTVCQTQPPTCCKGSKKEACTP